MAPSVFLFWATAVVSLAIAAYMLCCRPSWAHLDYDKQLWQLAVQGTREWISEYRKAEGVVIVGAFVMAFLTAPSGDVPDRLGYAAVNGVGAVLIGVVLLFLWKCSQAPWRLHAKAQDAPFNADVAFATFVEQNVVYLRIRNHLQTGFFSAQIWLIGGISNIFSDAFSAAWKSTPDEKREIIHEEEQLIKLLRVDKHPPGDGHAGFSRIVVFEAGDHERQVHPQRSHGHGSDVQSFSPIELHLHVIDPRGTKRPVNVYVHILVIGNRVEFEPYLIRDY